MFNKYFQFLQFKKYFYVCNNFKTICLNSKYRNSKVKNLKFFFKYKIIKYYVGTLVCKNFAGETIIKRSTNFN